MPKNQKSNTNDLDENSNKDHKEKQTSSDIVNNVVRDLDTLESIRTETLEEKEFDNPVSKRYGVEIKSENVSEKTFTNLKFIDSYPINEYSYVDSDGDVQHLVEVYILQNRRTKEFIYYLDEPKLSSMRAGTDDPDVTVADIELKWYNRIKSDFDTIISNIDKKEFTSKAISEISKDIDDLEYVINKIENDEFAWYRFKNKVLSIVYDNIFRDVVDMIESLPEKEDVMYETIPEETKMKIRYYLQQEYLEFGKISPMMNDPFIEEINANGPHEPIQVYHSNYDANLITNHAYSKQELRNTMNMLANVSGEQLNTANPQADGSLPDGSRINLVLGEESDGVAVKGDNFTIRVFDEVPLTPIDLLNYDTMSVGQMVWIWLAVQYGNSGIIAGGTASGKTTSLNAISTFTAPSSKIVTIEDTQELVLHSDNFIQGVTRQSVSSEESYDIGMMSLVKSALRQRPDYLIIGEVRDEAARPMFQAMATGHTSYATFHASNISELKNRLTGDPINVGVQMLNTLDFVIHQNKLSGSGRRVIEEIREIIEVDENDNLSHDLVTEFNHEKKSTESKGFENIDFLESNIMENVRVNNGWSWEDLHSEIEQRKELLQYMSDNMTRGDEHDAEKQRIRSKKITKIIKLYMRNPDAVMRLKETDLMLEDDIDTYLDMFIALDNGEKLAQYLDDNNIKLYKDMLDANEKAINLAEYINKKQEENEDEHSEE